jgi:hypothetical protein
MTGGTKLGLYLGRVSNQDKREGRMSAEGIKGGRHRDRGAAFASHGINCYTPFSQSGSTLLELLSAEIEDFLTLVEAIGRDVVTTVNLARCLICRQRWASE